MDRDIRIHNMVAEAFVKVLDGVNFNRAIDYFKQKELDYSKLKLNHSSMTIE